MPKPKVRIIACADNFHFIKDLIPALSDEFDIKITNISTGTGWKDFISSDVIWLEWADGKSLRVLDIIRQSCSLVNTKTILRLHRYELFTPRTLDNIAALSNEFVSRIDRLVFVSKVVQQIGISKFPWMAFSDVIPNLIDHTKFPFQEKTQGFNIMMLGRMSYVKNLPLALSMFNELSKINYRYKLHIVGEIAEPELIYYTANFVKKSGLDDRVVFHGRIDNDKLPEFMKDMNYILCASIFESFGMGILEAMCCGLKPVIFDFPGAENIFPEQWRWIDSEQFINRIEIDFQFASNSLTNDYNEWAVEYYSIEKNIYLYKDLINGVLNEKTQKERIQTDVF